MGCLAAAASRPTALRPALPAIPALEASFEEAAAEAIDPAASRRFFENRFVPIRVAETEAFFTGYYEPVLPGSLEPTVQFSAPLLARPDDLVTLPTGASRPAWADELAALRRLPDGTLGPYPDRTSIDADAQSYRPVVWLRDPIECFMVQVQGSARVRLPDGSTLRLTYAGRNGQTYTSIGRVLVEAGAFRPEEMSLDRLKAWVRASGQAPGQAGHALMMRNRSMVFFAAEPDPAPQLGPTGGAGLPLTACRSIAVDRTRWCYGLPFWIDVTLPGEDVPFRRLCIAEDTGSAIVGDTRIDLFMGSGEAAGQRAGSIRHHGALVVLWPRHLAN